MSSTGRLALALAAALAAPAARAQWRTEPMVVWLDGPQTAVVGRFAGSSGADVLVVDQQRARAEVRPFHDLLARQPTAFAPPYLGAPRALRAGYLAQAGGDARADVTRIGVDGVVQVAFGDALGALRSYAADYPRADEVASFLHLLPRFADVLVVPQYPNETLYAAFTALDFDPLAVPTGARPRTWTIAPVHLNFLSSQGFEAVPLRLSDVARTAGLDDVALLGAGGVVLLLHTAVPAAPTLEALQLSAPIEVGGNHGGQWEPPWSGAGRPPWLPSSVARPGDSLGVAVLDVDRDGDLDLVLAQSILSLAPGAPPLQGAAVWVEGTGTPADLADPALAPWHDLGLELGLDQPVIVRQVSVGGAPAVAIWSWTALEEQRELVVLWNEGGTRRVWRAPAPGALATDIRSVDLVGSPAPDLLVVMENGAGPGAVLVYPDLGAPGPALRWAPGSPGVPARGVPHALAVEADPAGAVSVDWVLGAVTSAPVGAGLAHVFPPDCSVPPPPLVVTARGTDATGVFTELRATLPLATLEPALALSGAAPGRLVLPPGGTTAVFEGTAATGCGAAAFAGTPWPVEATVTDTVGPTSICRTVALPEAAYPELLAHPAFQVSLSTSDPGATSPVVTLPLVLDGAGLVEVSHGADRTRLAQGEIAVVRTRVRSRLGVPLPGVRIVDALAGLEPAGSPAVSGAVVVASGAGGADLLLDVLPPAGAEVTIDLPVRAVAGGGASAVEARAAGGWLLTAPARPAAIAGPPPGCGCGAGGGAGLLGIALAALALRPRRPARPT